MQILLKRFVLKTVPIMKLSIGMLQKWINAVHRMTPIGLKRSSSKESNSIWKFQRRKQTAVDVAFNCTRVRAKLFNLRLITIKIWIHFQIFRYLRQVASCWMLITWHDKQFTYRRYLQEIFLTELFAPHTCSKSVKASEA